MDKIIQKIINQIQKIPQEIIKIDAAITELNKTSRASSSELKKYFKEAAESAKYLGTSVSDLITATAGWSRAGYNLPDSRKLAETAILYRNISNSIDIDSAGKTLAAILQGFNLQAGDAMHIIDAFSEVSSRFPIGSDGIGEALKDSAASMYAAGNTLEESVGLITAAGSIMQDPDSVGTAYQTISMRIRGAKDEMEELGLDTRGMTESTAALRKEIMSLSGIDIMDNQNTFKSTYRVLDELAAKWQDLTESQQSSVTELIAGKSQGNIIPALISNFETARQAAETAVNSSGSALEAQKKYEQGIQYSLDRLDASFQTFASHVLDSKFLKGIADFGNGIINIIDKVTSKLGSSGTIGIGLAGFLGRDKSKQRFCPVWM